jgi:flavin reductase (DIM6/NTAB) family NADH-FMN oxidoreductase RutF
MRKFMNGFPSGISVLTVYSPDSGPRGMTCTSLASVALCPPTIVVCVRSTSRTLHAVLTGGQFSLNLLHEHASRASELFASPVIDRFDRVKWEMPVDAAGPHLTVDAHAIADCEVAHSVEIADHTAVFAEIRRIAFRNIAEPLLYGRRRYARWSDAAAVPPPRMAP